MAATFSLAKTPGRIPRTLRLSDKSSKHSHHRRAVPHGPRYKPGDPVRESGIYEVIHGGEHRNLHEVVLLKDDAFPLCETCQDNVRFRLIRTAPYIFQDGDFEEQV